jgi:hypothetical protein
LLEPGAGAGPAGQAPRTLAKGSCPASWLVSTESPGFGKPSTPAPSTVLQYPAMLATKMPGNEPMYESLLDPPVISRGAQFMYISRLPILLNQVQANMYLPLLISLDTGMSNLRTHSSPLPPGHWISVLGRLPWAEAGQPPMME